MKEMLKMVVHVGIFVVPFIVLIVANTLFFPFITGKNFAFRIIVEITFAAWLLLALYDKSYRPKFSWILAMFGGLLVVMLFADAFGVHPLQSFWSNFERMEGYVTLVHVFMYFIVVGTVVTTQKMWDYLLNATLAAAVLLSFYAFAQLSGNIKINQGGWRLDGTLGNSAYMAIYMLFMIFMSALMIVRTKSRGLQYMYGALGALFIFLLLQTATRGSILGFAGGSVLTVAYIALFAKNYPQVRKISAGILVSLVVLFGAFFALKDTDFIKNSPHLNRVASITLSEGTTRFSIWSMAFEGVKERPILGWGQSNFNYVFNEYYRPTLYAQEPWFDRVHDIVLDWLIAGGVLGAFFYFGILVSAVFYIAIRPLLKVKSALAGTGESFSLAERGVVFGLLAAYVFHNLFVFDNIVSYIFYAMILAFIHSRVSYVMPSISEKKIDQIVVDQVAVPVVGVALLAIIYFVNVPGILAAGDIIDAFSAQDPHARIAAFDKALSRGSFGDQEIREQLTQQSISMARSTEVPEAAKQLALKRSEEELLKQVEEKSGDARVYVFLASYYRSIGKVDKALPQLELARKYSPLKQQIIFEQGFAHLQIQDYESALKYFKEAYDLEPRYNMARTLYAATGMYLGKPELYDQLIDTDDLKLFFANNDIAVQAVYQNHNYKLLQDMFSRRVAATPDDIQSRVNLAVAYYEGGNVPTAIGILEKAVADIPSFKTQGEGFIADLKAGRAPGQPAEAPVVNVGGKQVEVKSN